MTASALPLDEFLSAARDFLDRSATLRSTDAERLVVDRVALFRGSTAEEAQAARDWQRTVFDAGYGWITGPVDEGGAGLPGAYEGAYLTLEREYDVPSRGPLAVSLG
nr:acyl-CoA dehydrogenase [Actinomycetota bacterium]